MSTSRTPSHRFRSVNAPRRCGPVGGLGNHVKHGEKSTVLHRAKETWYGMAYPIIRCHSLSRSSIVGPPKKVRIIRVVGLTLVKYRRDTDRSFGRTVQKILYYPCYRINRVPLYIKSLSLSAIAWRITGGIVEFTGGH